MTDEVGDLVLDDNYEQNIALANAEANAGDCSTSTRTGCVASSDRACSTGSWSSCPRASRSPAPRPQGGLTAPELSVLLAYTKIVLADELIETDLPDDPSCVPTCSATSRARCRHYRQQMEEHPLRREIIVTQVVNELVNGAGRPTSTGSPVRRVRRRPRSPVPTSWHARSSAHRR